MENTETPKIESLEGVRIEGHGLRLVIRAKAGAPGWGPFFVVALFAIWTGAWATGLGSAVSSARTNGMEAATPALFLCGIATLLGFYMTLLSLWTMFGHETVVLQGHSLWMGTPWFFGFPFKRYDLRKISAFACSGKDCGAQAEGCCCSWSAVDYHLAFTYRGKRIVLFVQLPRATKDRLRDILEDGRKRAVEML